MTTKVDFLRPKSLSQADEIRAHLQFVDDASIGLDNKNRGFILGYLARMDAIAAFIQDCLAYDCPDLSGEELLFELVQKRLWQNAPAILKAVGGAKALAAARPTTATQTGQPWWFIDLTVARQQALKRKRWLQGLGALAVIGLLLIILSKTILKPNFASMYIAQHYDAALGAIMAKRDYTIALSEIEQALLLKPDDVEMLVFKGIVLERSNHSADATRAFNQAFALASRPEQVPYLQGQILLLLEDYQAALVASEAAIDLNPSFAEGWLLLGQVHDRLNQIPQAFDAMNIASQLAVEQGKPTLDGLIRFNIENLAKGTARR
jgi:tetratricopeptide (TPR) repeat protein